MSHQFRTPISSIHGYAQLLEDDSISTEEKLEYIEVIKEKSISLSNLINDVLELSRLEHLSASLEKELFSIDEQLRKCIISFADRLDEKKIDISLDLQAVSYLGCKELLAEVWNNLIENAIKYTKKGGTIVYSTCTLFDVENIEVVRSVLDKVELVNFDCDGLPNDQSYIRLLPSDGSDGFFIAKLKKI